MNVLIVVESYFGNTSMIAHAIAEGIQITPGDRQVQIITASETPHRIPAEISLVIVAAPTHNFGLPSPATRTQAHAKGATTSPTTGVREWIETVEFNSQARIITADTSVKARFTPSTASKTAQKLIRRRGVSTVERGPSFFVDSITGPLSDGEEDRARTWGTQLTE